MTTPVWFLDVDGVINAVNHWDVRPSGPWPDYECQTITGYPIWYSPAMLRRMFSWHSSGQVEIRWLTTWGDLANTELAPALGLPRLTVEGDRYSRGPGWWKLGAVKEWRRANPNTPFIWTDDDLLYFSVLEEDVSPGVYLWISPKMKIGLEIAHLDRIQSFLDVHNPLELG